MKFNSQICTTREQSERLLELGLKKETADMTIIGKYLGCDDDGNMVFEDTPSPYPPMLRKDIPAWSLHRLIKDLMPDTIAVENATCMGHRFFYNLTFWYDDVTYEVNSFVFKEFAEHDNYYDNIIDCIEWLIKEGYFNKDYLV